MTQKQCPYCGEWFTPCRGDVYTCSKPECQKERERESNREARRKAREETRRKLQGMKILCVYCMRWVTPKRGSQVTCCNLDCQYFNHQDAMTRSRWGIANRRYVRRDEVQRDQTPNGYYCQACKRALWGDYRINCPDCWPLVLSEAGECDNNFVYG